VFYRTTVAPPRRKAAANLRFATCHVESTSHTTQRMTRNCTLARRKSPEDCILRGADNLAEYRGDDGRHHLSNSRNRVTESEAVRHYGGRKGLEDSRG